MIVDERISPDALRSLDRRRAQSAKVKALVQCHGWPQDVACAAMGLNPSKYMPNVPPAVIGGHMPTPSEIESMTAGIRVGTVIVSELSAKYWREYREGIARADEAELADRFHLAGRIDDDACPMPAWFRG